CRAIDYGKKSGRTLFIDWADGQFAKKGVNAFNEYFELINTDNITDSKQLIEGNKSFYPEIWKKHLEKGIYDLFVVSESDLLKNIPYSFLSKGKGKMLKRYWQLAQNTSSTKSATVKNHFTGIMHSDNFPFGSDLPSTLKEDVVIYADFSPSYSEEIFLKHIRLKKIVLDKINTFAAEKALEKNTIGVHVRNTDKKPTQSIESIFSQIEKLGLKAPAIFLATDNKFVIEQFEKKYSNLILYPKFLPTEIKDGLHQYALYNNKEDIALQLFEDSIIDMWLLSKCEYLLYQGNSSFSVISKVLHSNKIKTINWLN
ncbi:MAG: hypothetical protein ACXVNM_13360, partial [Bacteroidia bacterium]